MFCYFCGNHIPDDAEYCPYCGKKMKQTFEFDLAYVSNETSLSRTASQYMDSVFSCLGISFILSAIYFWQFYFIEHNFTSFTTLKINQIYTMMTLVCCIASVAVFILFVKKKLKYPVVRKKFQVLSIVIISAFAYLFNYLCVLTPLGNANTTAKLHQTYTTLLFSSIGLFLFGCLFICIEIGRRKLCFRTFLQSIFLVSLYECAFYLMAFNYSPYASRTLAYILYAIPLICGACISSYCAFKKQ